MANQTPTVEHHFNGDGNILNATLDKRTQVRNALLALQQELQRIEGFPVQITADVRFNVSGPAPKEHIYSVSITHADFDSPAFARNKTFPFVRTAPASSGSATWPPTSNNVPQPPPSSRRSLESDLAEVRPFKRARPGPSPQSRDAAALPEDEVPPHSVDDLFTFVKDWRDDWQRQGSWLFDTLNDSTKAAKERGQSLDSKLNVVQDTLGQSINSVHETTMTELMNIIKLIPWLEQCRKTNADKIQVREEKWRTSSATFHDVSRKEREAAEKSLEGRMEAQRQLLIKIAEANGIDVDDASGRSTREPSLGAQLTAELNLEAVRAAGYSGARNDTSHLQYKFEG